MNKSNTLYIKCPTCDKSIKFHCKTCSNCGQKLLAKLKQRKLDFEKNIRKRKRDSNLKRKKSR